MKRIVLVASLISAINFFTGPLCAQQQIEYLNANMLNAGFGIGGNLFSRLDSLVVDTNTSSAEWLLYEVPQGSNRRTVFTASLWLTANDTTGTLDCAAQTYRTNGGDFYDGPIASVYDGAYDNYYNRVFKVTQAQIDSYRALVFPSNSATVDSSILLWPGKGNTFVASSYGVNIDSDLAPFVDVDNDGIYNPLKGDYPAICGIEAVFFVFNDERGPHGETQVGALNTTNKIGLEVHGLAYEFSDSVSAGFVYNKRAVNNTVFVQYDIENKSHMPYHNFYLGLFEDPELGCGNDIERVGCDTNRNLMFAYNGTTPEPNCGNDIGYASYYQAAHGVKMLNQNMSSFVYFTNGAVAAMADPSSCPEFENYMAGYWADGTPFTYGGTGYGGTQPTKFIFPGDPTDSSQWSEISVAGVLPAGDRRMTGAIGPMNFNIDERKQFDFAFTTSYDSTVAAFISIVDTLKRDEDIVQAFYNNNIVPCRNELIALGINQLNNNVGFNVSVYPNPSNSQIMIEADAEIQLLIMTDMTGRMVLQQNANTKKTALNVSTLAKGVYLLKIKSGNWLVVKKVVVE